MSTVILESGAEGVESPITGHELYMVIGHGRGGGRGVPGEGYLAGLGGGVVGRDEVEGGFARGVVAGGVGLQDV